MAPQSRIVTSPETGLAREGYHSPVTIREASGIASVNAANQNGKANNGAE